MNAKLHKDQAWLRHMTELAVCFVITVLVLRGFILEGYLISTGSMAPGLRGLHRQLQCPSCSYPFAFGMSFDQSVSSEATSSRHFATCPNCGQSGINTAGVPAAHGDQLLVQKGLYDFRAPRRWETVVFRNPALPGEAYVKRVVGLPGESVQVIDGDLFVSGRIARKNFRTQRDMRIPVFDLSYCAKDGEWQMPWQPDSGWSFVDGQFVFESQPKPGGRTQPDEPDWIRLQFWKWYGGTHYSEVLLPGDYEEDWQICLAELNRNPISWTTRFTYDRDRQVLRFQGVMPYEMQDRMTSWPLSESFRSAIYRLGALSHSAPITDSYGYNSLVPSPEYPVHDLMLDSTLSWQTPPDAIAVCIPMQNEVFRAVLNFKTEHVELILESTRTTVATGSMAELCSAADGRVRLEVSNFDQRVTVAVNGELPFAPLDVGYDSDDAVEHVSRFNDRSSAPALNGVRKTAESVNRQSRLAIGVTGTDAKTESLVVYRDVYYTPGRRVNGVDEPFEVSEGHYFVQGDNSPVSSDSRNWPDPQVPHHLLLGKPFVVHLPSKPGKLGIGGLELPIRIPDFARIRYIR